MKTVNRISEGWSSPAVHACDLLLRGLLGLPPFSKAGLMNVVLADPTRHHIRLHMLADSDSPVIYL